jgi:hypothetical protein
MNHVTSDTSCLGMQRNAPLAFAAAELKSRPCAIRIIM